MTKTCLKGAFYKEKSPNDMASSPDPRVVTSICCYNFSQTSVSTIVLI